MTTMRSFATLAVIMLGLAALKALQVGENVMFGGLLESPAMAADAPPSKDKEGAGKNSHDKADDEGEGEEPVEPKLDAYVEADRAAQAAFATRSGLSRQELNVLSRLGERRAELDAREADIETQARLLEAAEARLDARMAELDALKQTVERLLGQLGEQEAAELERLVIIYQTMKPKAAAAIFEEMDRNTLVDVASRMKNASLSSIMAAMDTEKAVALTTLLAQRHRQPETLDEARALLGEEGGGVQ